MTFLDRFWSRVAVAGDDECWLWTGNPSTSGYGYVENSNGSGRWRHLQPNRVAWELAHAEPIPVGMFVLHSCDVPLCVNPAHLRVGTPADNMRDMVERGRDTGAGVTHCKHGHPFDEKNTYYRKGSGNGRRDCRACRVERYKLRKAAA